MPGKDPALLNSTMTFDPVVGRLVLFGCEDGKEDSYSAYEFDGSDWSLRSSYSTELEPFTLETTRLVFDMARRTNLLIKLILFLLHC